MIPMFYHSLVIVLLFGAMMIGMSFSGSSKPTPSGAVVCYQVVRISETIRQQERIACP